MLLEAQKFVKIMVAIAFNAKRQGSFVTRSFSANS